MKIIRNTYFLILLVSFLTTCVKEEFFPITDAPVIIFPDLTQPITNTQTPLFEWTEVPNATLYEVFIDSVKLDNNPGCRANSTSCQLSTALTFDSHTIQVIAKNEITFKSSEIKTFIMGKTSNIIIQTPKPPQYYRNSVLIEADIDIVKLMNTDVFLNGSIITNYTGNLSRIDSTFNISSIADGTHSIQISCTNILNTVLNATTSFIKDNTPPVLNITSPLINATATGAFLFSGNASDNFVIDKIEYNLDNAGFIDMKSLLDATGFWSSTSTFDAGLLPDGTVNLNVRAFDRAGNFSDATIPIVINNGGPVITFKNPAYDGYGVGGSFNLIVNATDAQPISKVEYKIDNGSYLTTSYALFPPFIEDWGASISGLTDGTHTITVRAFDSNNYFTQKSINVIKSSTALVLNFLIPTIDSISPKPVVYGTQTNYTFDATENRFVVEAYSSTDLLFVRLKVEESTADWVPMSLDPSDPSKKRWILQGHNFFNFSENPNKKILIRAFDQASQIRQIDGTIDLAKPPLVNILNVGVLFGGVRYVNSSIPISISGDAYDFSGVQGVSISIDSNPSSPATIVGPVQTPTWNILYPNGGLIDGSATIYANAFDSRVEQFDSTISMNVVLDRTSPILSIINATSDASYAVLGPDFYFNGNLSVAGTAVDVNLNTVTESRFGPPDGSDPIVGTASWTSNFDASTLGVPDATYNLVFTATDYVGLTDVKSRLFRYDNTLPTMSITFPVNGTLLSFLPPLNFTGNVSDNTILNSATLYINSTSAFNVPVTGNPWTFSLTTPADGTYSVYGVAIDIVGNTFVTAINNFTYDGNPPIINILNSTSDASSDFGGFTYIRGNLTITGDASDALLNAVWWKDNNSILPDPDSTGNVAGLTSWSQLFNTTLFADGMHTLVFEASDTVGNNAFDSTTFVFDNTLPAMSITAPINGASLSFVPPLVFNGTATDNTFLSSAILYINSTAPFSVPVSGNPWTYNHATPADGTYSVYGIATDIVGNTFTTPINNFTYDGNPPVINILNSTSDASTTIGSTTYVKGNLTITGNATDALLNAVWWKDNNSILPDPDSTGNVTGLASWSQLFNTTTFLDGLHILQFEASDTVGTNTSDSTTFIFDNTIPNKLTITNPINNASFAGSNITLNGDASDNFIIDRVAVYINGVLDGNAVITPNLPFDSLWIYNKILPGEATYSFYTIVYDELGSSLTSATANAIYDITYPNISLTGTTPVVGNVVNYSDGNTYARGTLRFDGTASDNISLAYVKINYSPPITNLYATGTNTWSDSTDINTAILSNALYTFTFTVTDDSTLSSSTTKLIYIDNLNPLDATFPTPNSNAITSGAILINLSPLSDNFIVDRYEIWHNGAFEASDSPLSLNKSLNMTFDGTHSVYVKVYDEVGNDSTSMIIPFYHDGTPPVLTMGVFAPLVNITTYTNGFTYVKGILNFDGTATDNAAVKDVLIGDGTASNLAVGGPSYAPWTYAYNFGAWADGTINMTVTASDYAGYTDSSAFNFIIDNNAPTAVSVINPLNNTYHTGSITIDATATDSFFIDQISVYLDGLLDSTLGGNMSDASWSYALPFVTDGPHSIYVIAYDEIGNNTTSSSILFTKDGTPPVLNSFNFVPSADATVYTNGLTYVKAVTFSGTATDNVAIQSVRVNDGTANNFATGTSAWTYDSTLSTWSDGSYSFITTIYDFAGQSDSTTINLILDKTPPHKSLISSPLNNATVAGTINVVGDASDNFFIDKVQLFVDGLLSTGTGFLSGPLFDFSLPLNTNTLTEGTHALTVRATDELNQTIDSTVVTIGVDRTSPTSSILFPTSSFLMTSTGAFTIYGNATDNISISTINLIVDGSADIPDSTSGTVTNQDWKYYIDPSVLGWTNGNSYNINVNVTDWFGNSSSNIITITINDSNFTDLLTFNATDNCNYNALSWVNPATPPFNRVDIYRKAGGLNNATCDGTLIYSGSATSLIDATISLDISYFYSACAYDISSNLITSGYSSSVIFGSWQVVGTEVFSQPFTSNIMDRVPIAFTTDASAYITFKDASNGNEISAMKYVNSPWSYTPNIGANPFSGGEAGYHSMAISTADGTTPYVAYRDEGNSDQGFVSRIVSGAWSILGGGDFDDSNSNVQYTAIAFDPSTNEPYVAYSDAGTSDEVRVRRYSAGWATVGGGTISSGTAKYIDIKFNPGSNRPYVAFTDAGATNKIRVRRWTGAFWVDVGPAAGFSTGDATNNSLVFHPGTNEPYVAYIDGGVSNKVVVKRFTAGAWANVGSSASSGSAEYCSIAIHPTTLEPYVAFRDLANGNKTTVVRYDGTNWVGIGPAGYNNNALWHTLKFNPLNNEPFVSFGTDATPNYKTSVFRYGACSWP